VPALLLKAIEPIFVVESTVFTASKNASDSTSYILETTSVPIF
jgi:hypothetical protein